MWFSVRQDLLLRFRVRACHSVRLTLSGIIDLPETQTYEVEIGRCYQALVLDRVRSIQINFSGDLPLPEPSLSEPSFPESLLLE